MFRRDFLKSLPLAIAVPAALRAIDANPASDPLVGDADVCETGLVAEGTQLPLRSDYEMECPGSDGQGMHWTHELQRMLTADGTLIRMCNEPECRLYREILVEPKPVLVATGRRLKAAVAREVK